MHLDGARFFNAITALACYAKDLADCADNISVCFSKELGAPMGSVLVGSSAITGKALRNRRILGGGMRQAGVLAAAATLADALCTLDVGTVQNGTNMVFFTPSTGGHDKLAPTWKPQACSLAANTQPSEWSCSATLMTLVWTLPSQGFADITSKDRRK